MGIFMVTRPLAQSDILISFPNFSHPGRPSCWFSSGTKLADFLKAQVAGFATKSSDLVSVFRTASDFLVQNLTHSVNVL